MNTVAIVRLVMHVYNLHSLLDAPCGTPLPVVRQAGLFLQKRIIITRMPPDAKSVLQERWSGSQRCWRRCKTTSQTCSTWAWMWCHKLSRYSEASVAPHDTEHRTGWMWQADPSLQRGHAVTAGEPAAAR